MKYLILTVFLAVTQASVPIPRKTADNPASTRGNIQNKSQNKNASPDSKPPLISQDQSQSTDGNRSNQGDKNANSPIRISELPPVTVLPTKRDWFDRLYWGFGALLALTSILQIILLFKTIGIYRQQRDQMIQAGQQTEQVIAQMKDTAIRDLRAYVGVSKIKLDISDPGQPVGLVEIQNFGRSPAYKVRHWTGISPQPYPLIATLPPSPATEFSVAVLHPNVPNLGVVALKKRLPNSVAVGTQQWTIYVYGEVIYEDAFGNQRHTHFRFFFGGPEPVQTYQETSNGAWYGVMKPYSEGNESN